MVEVVGVYDVPDAPEPCYLIEMVVPSGANVGDITQVDPDQPESNWQVPWDERVLSTDGKNERVAFFFHYLNPHIPLTTPWGEMDIPQPTPRPERLASVEYEQP